MGIELPKSAAARNRVISNSFAACGWPIYLPQSIRITIVICYICVNVDFLRGHSPATHSSQCLLTVAVHVPIYSLCDSPKELDVHIYILPSLWSIQPGDRLKVFRLFLCLSNCPSPSSTPWSGNHVNKILGVVVRPTSTLRPPLRRQKIDGQWMRSSPSLTNICPAGLLFKHPRAGQQMFSTPSGIARRQFVRTLSSRDVACTRGF